MFRRALIPIFALIAISASAEKVISPLVTVRMIPEPKAVAHIMKNSKSPNNTALDFMRNFPTSISGFVGFRGKSLPTMQTEVRLAYDNANLYIAFRCFDPNAQNLGSKVLERDGPAWRDDSVEVFLDPKCDSKTFFHLVANCAGTRFDSRGQSTDGKSWDGNWSVVTNTEKDAWTATFIIPFDSLGVLAPKPGEVWKANFARHQISKQEFSTWSPVEAEFNEPSNFGRIVFQGNDALIASISPTQILLPKKHQFKIKISNPTKKIVSIHAEALLDEKLISLGSSKVLPGDSELNVSVSVPEGKHKLSLAVLESPTKREIVRGAPVSINIAPNRARLEKYRAIVRNCMAKTPEISKAVGQLKLKLNEILSFSLTANTSTEKWAKFTEKLDAIERDVARARYACADKESKGYLLAPEVSLNKVFREKLFEGEIGAPLKLSLARNEYESGQVLILPYARALRDVKVAVSPLKGPGGAVIPTDRIKLELVDYVKTRKPRYDVEYVGWWPDPLLEMKAFDVSPDFIQPIWLTVHAPEDIPAGVYKGAITIKPANAPESSLPIEVKVWNFSLPTTLHLKTAFALFPHEISAWYGGMTEEIKLRYYEFMLEHRLNPTNIYTNTPAPSKEDLPFCIQRGLNAFCLAYTHNRDENGRAELAKMIKEYEVFLKERGWWDKAYLYGFDEIKPDKYAELRDMYGWVKKEFPDLPRMCTVAPNKELKGYVDIWVPLTSNWQQNDAEEYTKAGDEVWWYVCCVPAHPYPNFFIDYPAIDPRVIFWMNWKYRIPGFLYYAVNNWTTNRVAAGLPEEHRAHEDPKALEAIREGKRWPDVPWNTFTFDDYNGDGHLIYPGPGGKPFSSIRLECIRDGIEDYEYFYLLSKLACKADSNSKGKIQKVLAVSDTVVRSPKEYTLDPHVLLKAREEVAELIEKLSAKN